MTFRMLSAETAWPGCGRSACRSAAKTSSVPSRPSTLIAAATSATTSSSRRSWMARHSIPSMPSVPLMRARPSFSSSSTGAMPAAASASAAGIRSPCASRDLALAHERERAVRERGEVAGAAERAVLVDDRRDAGVEHGDVRREGLVADAGATGGERRDAQQHEGAHDLALDLRAGAGGVRADEGALQLAAHVDGDVPGGEGAEAGGDAVVGLGVVGQAADDLAGAPDLGEGLVGSGRPGRRGGRRARPRRW